MISKESFPCWFLLSMFWRFISFFTFIPFHEVHNSNILWLSWLLNWSVWFIMSKLRSPLEVLVITMFNSYRPLQCIVYLCLRQLTLFDMLNYKSLGARPWSSHTQFVFLMVNVVLQVVKEIKLNSISNFVDNVFV